jgi:hypothetical protein
MNVVHQTAQEARQKEHFKADLLRLHALVGGRADEDVFTAMQRLKDALVSMTAVLADKDAKIARLEAELEHEEAVNIEHRADLKKSDDALKEAKRWEDGFRAIGSYFVLGPQRAFEVDEIVREMFVFRTWFDSLINADSMGHTLSKNRAVEVLLGMLWRKP